MLQADTLISGSRSRFANTSSPQGKEWSSTSPELIRTTERSWIRRSSTGWCGCARLGRSIPWPRVRRLASSPGRNKQCKKAPRRTTSRCPTSYVRLRTRGLRKIWWAMSLAWDTSGWAPTTWWPLANTTRDLRAVKTKLTASLNNIRIKNNWVLPQVVTEPHRIRNRRWRTFNFTLHWSNSCIRK